MFWRKLHHASVSRTTKAGKTLPGAWGKRNQTRANHRVRSKTLKDLTDKDSKFLLQVKEQKAKPSCVLTPMVKSEVILTFDLRH